MSLLAEILSSRIRAEVFRLLFDGRGEELHMRELERRTGFSIGAIQTEVRKLTRLDLVQSRRDGNRLYYRANLEHPIYPDLNSLVGKTVGVIGLLQEALRDREEVGIAFLFGSFARGEVKAQSDIDLMILGSLGLRQLSSILSSIGEKTGREINPHVMTLEEYVKRKEKRDHFVFEVAASPRIMIKGNPHDLEELG